MNSYRYDFSIGTKILGCFVFIFLNVSVVYGNELFMKSENAAESDVAINMAEGIMDENVQIVVAKIPAKQGLDHIFKGMNEKELMNALSLFSNFSLYQLEVVGKIRGEIAKNIFVTPMLDTANKSYSPFSLKPGSTWILFLMSPLDPLSKKYKIAINSFGGIEYNRILSKANYFEVYNNGYSAYCLNCAEQAIQEGAQKIITSKLISDVKRLVRYYYDIKNDRQREKARADVLSTLETDIGNKIFTEINKNM